MAGSRFRTGRLYISVFDRSLNGTSSQLSPHLLSYEIECQHGVEVMWQGFFFTHQTSFIYSSEAIHVQKSVLERLRAKFEVTSLT